MYFGTLPCFVLRGDRLLVVGGRRGLSESQVVADYTDDTDFLLGVNDQQEARLGTSTVLGRKLESLRYKRNIVNGGPAEHAYYF